MLYYVASYPRSGNIWVLSLIRYQFLLRSSSVYGYDSPGVSSRKWLLEMLERHKGMAEFPRSNPVERLLRRDPLLGRWVYYWWPSEPGVKKKVLVPGLGRLLQRTRIRRRLAAEGDPVILKTHDLPHPAFFDGEHVIQIVRNPGACLWSYFNYTRDYENRRPSLSSLIDGRYGAGDWSGYHRAWLRAVETMRERYLVVRYEDLFGHELDFCRRLEAFWGFPILSRQVRSFEFLHQWNPRQVRSGQPGGWEGNYSRRQLRDLWSRHGEIMAHFGYSEPEYDRGSDQELH